MRNLSRENDSEQSGTGVVGHLEGDLHRIARLGEIRLDLHVQPQRIVTYPGEGPNTYRDLLPVVRSALPAAGQPCRLCFSMFSGCARYAKA